MTEQMYRVHDLIEPTADGRGAIFAFREGEYPPDPDGEQPPSDFWLNVREDDGQNDDGYDLYVDADVALKLVRRLLPLCAPPTTGEFRAARGGRFLWDSDRVTAALELLAPLWPDEPPPDADVLGEDPF